jgi:hypothetical protein
MKTIKTITSALFLMISMTIQAQEVMTVKTENSFDGFQLTSRFVLDLTKESPVVRTNEKSIVLTAYSKVIIQLESMEDDINNIQADANTNTKEDEDNIYDLSGRKVQKPNKGVFIKNGKKVLIK